MAIPKRTIKGLHNIRTNIDRSDQFVEPYKGYLRVGSLEMERARKLLEKGNIEDRLREIEARVRQLDSEKTAILRVIEIQTKRQMAHHNPSTDVDAGQARPYQSVPEKDRFEAKAARRPVETTAHKVSTTQPEQRVQPQIQVEPEPVKNISLKPNSGGFKIRY